MIKETKGRSRGKTPFTIITKTASPKRTILNPKKILPRFKKKNLFYPFFYCGFYNIKKSKVQFLLMKTSKHRSQKLAHNS